MPFFPYGSYIADTFLLFVLGAMATFPDTRIALIVGPAWMALLLVVYFALGYNKQAKLMTARQLI